MNGSPSRTNDDEDDEERSTLNAFGERCGGAPWWVFLMINLAVKPQKLTEIRVHNCPEAVAFSRNRTLSPRHHVWAVVQRTGPFWKATDALFVFRLWEHKTRGPAPRIVQGLFLTEIYGSDMGFSMRTVPFPREEFLALASDGLQARRSRVARRRGRRGRETNRVVERNEPSKEEEEKGDGEEEESENESDDKTVKLAEFYRRYAATFA